MIAYLQAADFLLNTLSIKIGVGATGLGIELERNLYLWHLLLQFGCLYAAIGIKQIVAQGVECYAAIHGACIYIYIAHFAGQVLGHCAFTARAVAIDCNCYLLHNVYDILIISDDVLT